MKNFEKLLQLRLNILETQWWLTKPNVKNSEWLYLYEEETRNSIMIEGYFTSKKEIQDVIWKSKKNDYEEEIIWYFDAASLVYEFWYQRFKDKETFQLKHSDIKTIHSLMFRGQDRKHPWSYREWNIVINKAKIQPPHNVILWDCLDFLLEYSNSLDYSPKNLITSLSKFHILFESTHPFEDGNGRVWRMLINYILLSHGYPNIIIKWVQSEKEKYFSGLEEWEIWLHKYFPNTVPTKYWDAEWDFTKMEKIIWGNLLESLDYLILSHYKSSELRALSHIVEKKWFSPDYARQLVNRKKIIATKVGKSWYSHPELVNL